MRRVLLAAPILIAGAFFALGAHRPNLNFASVLPTAPALTGNESPSHILKRAQDFLGKSKSTSYEADFVIQASQNGATPALFPAGFHLSYSANVDKYLYEVTSPEVGVGSAILIQGGPTVAARNSSRGGIFRKAGYAPAMMAISEADVVDGCSSIVYNADGSCGNCDGIEIAGEPHTAEELQSVSYKRGVTKVDGTFMKMIRTGAFDLPYLTATDTEDAELVKGVSHKGEESSVVRVPRGRALALGHGDIQITVRHRDGAPVAFDYFDNEGKPTKHFEASYVGAEMTSLSAVDYQQNLELNIELKSVGSIKRNVKLDDSMFTVDHLYTILNKKKSAVAE
jgi:hypothetical protein